MLAGLSEASKIPTHVLNVLEQPAPSSAEQFQTIFDLVMFTFPAEEVLKEVENRNLSNPVVKYGVMSLCKEER